jgi:hypothetical protein
VDEERKRDELSQEELDSLLAEELPQREAMSVLRVPFLGNAPVESADAVEPTESELPDE